VFALPGFSLRHFIHNVSSVISWQGPDSKKPTTVASRGFLSKFNSASTSPGGVANNDDYQ
jgi:hypothetical protein